MNDFRGDKRYSRREIKKFNFEEYFFNNPVSNILYICITFGFGILTFYFWNNSYFPSVSFNDLPSLFIVIGVIGIIYFLLFLGMLLFAPFLFNSNDKELHNITYHENRKKDIELKSYTFFLPLLFFLIGISFLFYTYDSKSNSFINNFYYLFLLTIVFSSFIYYKVLKKFNLEYKFKTYINYLARLIVSFFIILLTTYMLIYSILSNNVSLKENGTIYIFVIFFTCLFSLFALMKEDLKLKMLFSIGLMVVIFIYGGKNSVINFTNKIIYNLGLGLIKTDIIYIKNKKDKESYCFTIKDICSDNKINNATIIWKLGNELFISVVDENKSVSKYIIDKKEVSGIKLYVKKEDNNTTKNR